jgi:Tfp pilus assembly protein PilF
MPEQRLNTAKLWWVCIFILGVFLVTNYKVFQNAGYRNFGFIYLLFSQNESLNGGLSALEDAPVDWVRRGHAIFPGDDRLLYALALSQWFQGELTAARSTMEMYLQTAPEDRVGRFVLGTIVYEEGDYAGAIQNWSSLASGTAFIHKASEELDAGNLDAAQRLLDTAVKMDITSYSVAYRLAERYMQLATQLHANEDNEKLDLVCSNGSIAFQSAIHAEPELRFVRINYGSFLRRCQQYQEAITQFLWAADSASGASLAWVNHEIALTYTMMQLPDEAVRYFEQAVDADPQNGLYRLSLGQAYLRVARVEEAREQLLQLLSGPDLQWKAAAESLLKDLK